MKTKECEECEDSNFGMCRSCGKGKFFDNSSFSPMKSNTPTWQERFDEFGCLENDRITNKELKEWIAQERKLAQEESVSRFVDRFMGSMYELKRNALAYDMGTIDEVTRQLDLIKKSLSANE